MLGVLQKHGMEFMASSGEDDNAEPSAKQPSIAGVGLSTASYWEVPFD
jgi:hypothetical protein